MIRRQKPRLLIQLNDFGWFWLVGLDFVFGAGGSQRFQEDDQLRLFGFVEPLECAGRFSTLATVKQDRFPQRCRTAIVKIRSRIGDSPKRRGTPLGRMRCIGSVRHGRRRVVVRASAHQLLAHSVQKQVRVNPLDIAEVRRVAVRAADRFKQLSPFDSVVCLQLRVGYDLDWSREARAEGGDLITLGLREVCAGSFVVALRE